MDSPITNLIERGLTSFWRVPKVSYIEKKDLYRLQFGYKSCYSFTNMAFRVQKLRFAYKYLIVNLQNCISNYKVASRIATRDYEEKSVNKIFYDNDRRKAGVKSAFRLILYIAVAKWHVKNRRCFRLSHQQKYCLFRQSPFVHDTEFTIDLTPVPDRSSPFFRSLISRQI